MSVSLGGFFSGLDTGSLIAQLTALNRQPIVTLQSQKAGLSEQSSAFNSIQSSLSTLRSRLTSLNDTNLYQSKAGTSSDNDIATVSVDSTATSSSTSINITQVATNSVLTGGRVAGAFVDTKLTAVPAVGDNISKILGVSDSTYDGTKFTVNNSQITLSSGETITSLLGKLNSVAGVAASYDSSTGKFSLTSGSTIVLGSGADTSDFLQRAQLFNNGTGSITSSIGVGRVDATTSLTSNSFRSGLTPSAGTFNVNGVSVTYTAGDSLNTVLSNINNSAAGVTAVYDSYTDRVVLTSKNRGAQNITVTDGSSNIASALRLTSTDSAIAVGNATQFTVGSDPTVRQSEDQTLTAAELGLTGVTVTAVSAGTVNLTVAPDTDKIKKTIDDFVTQYNSAQNLIQSYTKIDTSDLTKNGLLATDSTVSFLPSTLRSSTTDVLRSTGTIRMLEDLGIVGNSTDNTLTASDSTKLLAALRDHQDEVVDLFTNATSGLEKRLGGILDSFSQSGIGVLAIRQNSITDQNKRIDEEIARIEAQVVAEEAFLKKQFAALDSVSGQSQQFSSFFK